MLTENLLAAHLLATLPRVQACFFGLSWSVCLYYQFCVGKVSHLTVDMSGVEEAPRDQPKLITNLYFIARDPKYATVKPYTVRFDPKGKFPYTNIDNVKHSVELCNLRSSLNKFRIKENGFQIMTIPERMTYADFENDETFRAVHVPHILTALQAELKAKHVHVLDYRVSRTSRISSYRADHYQVRKRDENFPVRSEQQYEFLQPSSRVHIGKLLKQHAEDT